MKRMITVLTVCALFAGVSIASAQTTPPPTQTPPPQTPAPPPQTPPAAPAPVPFPADAKVAFISMQDLVALSDLGKAGSKEMQALHEAKNQQVAAKQKELTALEAKAQAQASVLSAEAAGNLRRELDRVTRELQYMKEQAQADVDLKNQELLTNFSQKVGPIIDAVRTEKGLWVIFAVQQAEGGVLAVAAAHPGVDLTMEIVRRLNAATAGK